MVAYATVEELSEYTGIAEDDLPDDADRMLDRASELMDRYSLGRIDTDKESHEEAAQKATCAQVEMWIEYEDESGLMSQFQSFSVGNLTVNTSNGQGLPLLAPRAFQHLVLAGLLRRSVPT